MLEKDSIFTGIIIGMITPVLGYVVVEFIFGILMEMNLMEYVSGSGGTRRQRTLALLGICSVLIPFQICKKKYFNNTMRGMVFPTLVYVAAWVYMYRELIM